MEQLDNIALYQILVKSDPLSVIQLCKTNIKFSNLCTNRAVFHNLMELHYPQFTIDENDPKQQYLDITGGIGVNYSIKIFLEERENIKLTYDMKKEILRLKGHYPSKAKKILNTKYQDDDQYNRFSWDKKIVNPQFIILGTEVLKTTYLLFEVQKTDYLDIKFDIKAYNSIEDAAEEFVTKNYTNIVNQLREDAFAQYMDDYTNKKYVLDEDVEFDDNIDFDDFTDILKDRYLPMFFSEEILQKYMIRNHYFSTNPLGSSNIYWRIIQVQLE